VKHAFVTAQHWFCMHVWQAAENFTRRVHVPSPASFGAPELDEGVSGDDEEDEQATTAMATIDTATKTERIL